MRRVIVGLAAVGLIEGAFAASPKVIDRVVAVCDPNAPSNCLVPGGGGSPSGSLPVVPNWPSSGKTPVTFSYNAASPSPNFVPIAGRPFVWANSGTLPTGLALKCSVDGGVTFLPIIVENLQMYAPTLAGLWEYQTSVFGEICRAEWTGTAAGTGGFYQ